VLNPSKIELNSEDGNYSSSKLAVQKSDSHHKEHDQHELRSRIGLSTRLLNFSLCRVTAFLLIDAY
jgi:hypothetical protein